MVFVKEGHEVGWLVGIELGAMVGNERGQSGS